MDEPDSLVYPERKKKGPENRRCDQDTYTTFENMPKFDNIKNQMAYHTIQSKSICEKRDLNNVPLQSNDSEPLVNTYKSHYFPQNKDAFEGISKISTMNENNQNISYFTQKDVSSSSNNNGKMWERKEICNNLASNENKSEIRKSKFLLHICKININAVLCRISLLVCLYCLYSTMNLNYQFKLNSSELDDLKQNIKEHCQNSVKYNFYAKNADLQRQIWQNQHRITFLNQQLQRQLASLRNLPPTQTASKYQTQHLRNEHPNPQNSRPNRNYTDVLFGINDLAESKPKRSGRGKRQIGGFMDQCACPPGPPGMRGKKGKRGARGSSGRAGPPGIPGPPGKNGFPGPIGLDGPKGELGQPGVKGGKGEIGSPGFEILKAERANELGYPLPITKEDIIVIKGEPGGIGPTGPSGPQGEAGLPGLEGVPGHPGKPGLGGEMGDAGAAGMPGTPGSSGQKGDRGLQVSSTSMGMGMGGMGGGDFPTAIIEGPPGSPGGKGEPGRPATDGKPGRPGVPGELGRRGKRGKEGVPGKPGMKGDGGIPGAEGLKGEPGTPGIDGLAGEKADKGASGESGLNGERGKRGRKGDKGEAGLTGPPGLDAPCPLGPDGLPLPSCRAAPDIGNGYADINSNRDSSLDSNDNTDEVTESYDASSNNRYGNVNYGADNQDNQDKEDKDKYGYGYPSYYSPVDEEDDNTRSYGDWDEEYEDYVEIDEDYDQNFDNPPSWGTIDNA